MPERIELDDSGLPPHINATVVTVGTFDGVHRGHRDVIEKLVARARALDVASVLVTFEPHPLEVVNPMAAPLLLTLHDEKLEVLAETGLDYVAVLPFTASLAAYSAEDFVELVLRRCFRLRELLIGYDPAFFRIDQKHAPGLKPAFLNNSFGRHIQHPDFTGHDHQVILGHIES